MKVVSLDNSKMQDADQSNADSGLETVDIHDRVAEAYFGRLGDRFMRETQQRIHWICGNAQGQRILDVGCSQGIASILLGREGKQVVGVDAAERSIEQAQGYLDQELARVRANVRFAHGDFMAQKFEPGEFDTIVIAEVLEHLLQPEAFIDEAARLLAPDGRLIVTVPFGLNNFVDHKRTYYLLDPYRLVSRHFEVVETAMLGKWLGLVGRRRAAKEKIPSTGMLDAELVQRLEASFLLLEQEIRDEAGEVRTRLNDANKKYRGATEQIAALKQRIAHEEQAQKHSETTLLQLQQQFDQAEQRSERIRSDLNGANLKYRSATEQIATLKQRLSEGEQTHRQKDAEVGLLRSRLAESVETREVLEGERARLTVQLALAERETEHLSSRLASAEEQMEAARRQGQAEIARLEDLIESLRAARHDAELRLAHTEAERTGIEQALADAREQLRRVGVELDTVRHELADSHAASAEGDRNSARLNQQIALAEQSAAQMLSHLSAAEQRLEIEQQARLEDVSRLESELEGHRESRHQAELRLSRLESEHGALTTRLDEANCKYRAATEQVATLKQRVQEAESANREHMAALEALQARLEAGDKTRDELMQESEAVEARLKEEIASHSRKLVELSVERDDQNARLSAVLVQLQEGSARIATLEAELDTVRAERDEAKRDVAGLQTELDAAGKSLNSLRSQFTATEARLERESAGAWDMAIHFETESAELRARLESSEELVRNRNDLIEELERQLAAAMHEHEQGERNAAQLRESFDRLKESFDTLRMHSSEIQARLEAENAALSDRAAELQASHDDLALRHAEANAKYRSSTEQYLALRDELARARALQAESAISITELKRQVEAGEQKIGAIEEQLATVLRDRDAICAERDRVASELETTHALRRGDQHQSEQLKLQVLRTKRAHADLQAKVERLRQQKIAAENQVAKTRAMLSFQLGYRLLHGFKSWRAFVQLPGQLLELRREILRRRAARAATATLRPESHTPAVWSPSSGAGHDLARPAMQPATLTLPDSDLAIALKSLRVAAIMDDFTFSSYRPECNLLQLSVSHWSKELEAFNPELLFIESAWRGKDEQWGSKVGHTSAEVVGIVEWCRVRKVPTVFWNKEDPVHFETFLSTAKLFDYVFTTDIDCIHRYKAALGHERVYLLPFACQPEANNPIEKYERKDAFCFAGAYYVRYPERTRDLGNFMTALSEYRPVDIYDRNHGKDDPNYQFPPEYKPFIVGNLPFSEIDKAYKGYRYAINLNSIKQSQSMFARRVYELLGCNTITVSNFSRGVRLLFGDLVVTTDSGEEIVGRLKSLAGDDIHVRKFRLAGLRKVMSSHTYQDRLAYVVAKTQGKALSKLLPGVVVTAYAKNQEQFDALLSSFSRHAYVDRRIVVVVPGGFIPDGSPADGGVQVLPASAADGLPLGELTGGGELVAGMVADDYYGPNYLLDLVLATRYSRAPVIGKVTHYVWSVGDGLSLAYPGRQYAVATSVPARCALVQPELVAPLSLREWVTTLYTRQIESADALSVDEFNYCKNGGAENFSATQCEAVDDLPGLDQGIPAEELILRAERIAPEEAVADETPVLTGEQFATYFKPPANKGYSLTVAGSHWDAESTLADGKHEYLYASTDLRPAELGFEASARFFLDVTPGLNLQIVLLFLDAQKQRISHVVKTANRNQEAAIPAGTEWIRFGLRVYGGGAARINGLVLGHRPLRPAEVLGRAEHLVLTNHYPSYDDLYRNGFVHSRVKAYAKCGVRVDVFRLRADEAMSYHEFQNVDVISGSQEALHKLLAGGHYKSVLVHFLDEAMWNVLQHHIERIKVFVWVHGAEIQPWHRRDYNFASDQEREAAKEQSEARMTFWRALLKDMPENLKLVFVSRYFAEEVMEDIGFRLPDGGYEVIHNPIDTDLFAYHAKPVEQRKKILSIRPYASRKYANDLSVRAILALKDKPYFKDLEFRLIGDGKLFDETLGPVKGLNNVYIERRFLAQQEIAALHREYGIFLCPTRMDAQGVSKDEAMSSGLVPVTNGVTAIPEFVDNSCGILAADEDAEGMANGIAGLYEDPDKFVAMSSNAAQRVRSQSGAHKIVARELQLFANAGKVGADA